MPKRDEYDELAKVDPTELKRFAKLDREPQRRIVELTRAPSKNPKVPKRDRQVAKARARQFERAMRRQRGRK